MRVTIGSGERGNTAFTIAALGSTSVAESGSSYWIHNHRDLIGLEMVVFKNTTEGQKIKAMLKAGEFWDLEKYIIHTFLEHLGGPALNALIQQVARLSYEDGRAAKAKEIRNALEGGRP